MDWTLNRNEIRILQLMASGDRKWSIKAISETIGVSPPWVSESVAHMRKMCILDVVRAGMTLEIKVSENDLGNAICKLMIENKQLNFERVLCGSSLRILPHLVTNSYSMNNIAEKSGLSYRTVMDYCNRWHRMGVAFRDAEGIVTINENLRDLRDFIIHFCRYHNMYRLNEIAPNGVILWQKSEEFLFSNKILVKGEDIHASGPSRLADLDHDILVDRYYMMFSRRTDPVTTEEALVQTILIDPVNPRPRKILNDLYSSNSLNLRYLHYYAEKYGIAQKYILPVM